VSKEVRCECEKGRCGCLRVLRVVKSTGGIGEERSSELACEKAWHSGSSCRSHELLMSLKKHAGSFDIVYDV
jgi:hypothetical protein